MRLESGRTEEETRREVAYLGWFALRPAIREQRDRARDLTRTLAVGGKMVTRNRMRVFQRLTTEERLDLVADLQETQTWIGTLARERASNARIAGDLIPELDR